MFYLFAAMIGHHELNMNSNQYCYKQNVSKRKLHTSCNQFGNVLMASISKQENHVMVIKLSISIWSTCAQLTWTTQVIIFATSWNGFGYALVVSFSKQENHATMVSYLTLFSELFVFWCCIRELFDNNLACIRWICPKSCLLIISLCVYSS